MVNAVEVKLLVVDSYTVMCLNKLVGLQVSLNAGS